MWNRALLGTFYLYFLCFIADAAPVLRLSSATVGPVSIAAGQNGPQQTLEAFNSGDGALSLTLASSATWAAASTGAPRACTTRSGTCLPININLQTASLSTGIHTARLTVADPNAADAPQEVTVTVQIGGGVPDSVTLFVAPNGSADQAAFTTNSELRATPGTPWLTLALDGGGSFRFTYPYRIVATHQPGQAEGAYTGTMALSGSTFAPDNKSVQVNLRVTSQPIARIAPERLRFRLAQDARPLAQFLTVSNRGLGTLAIESVTASEPWLAAESVPGGFVRVTASPEGLAPGLRSATVTIAANAANAPVRVPVDLEIVAPGPPLITYRGVVDNTTFQGGGTLAPGMLAALFGEQLTREEPASAASLPLDTELGGAKVLVNGEPAPVYFSSYGQITFQIPYSTQPGPALVQVERNGQRGNQAQIPVDPSAPRLLRLGIGDYGILVNQDGTFPIPTTPGIPSRPARRGDALVIYAIGFGQTDPPVQSGVGAPGSPLAAVPGFSVSFAGGLQGTSNPVAPFFLGLTPGFVGLYQINVVVPDDVPSGPAISLYVERGGVFSNRVALAIE
ncbi:MAG: hypothetical protein IPM24_14730 [Bryobacterales bacterium]|nr:hypothetical protein [Bryobacterales bacterium]